MFAIFVQTPEFSSQFEGIAPTEKIAEEMIEHINEYMRENGMHGYAEYSPVVYQVLPSGIATAKQQIEGDLDWMAEHDMI